MSNPKNYISFTLIHAGEEFLLQTFWGEYRNLRDLISDKLFLEGFGECGGMGRCGTCMVEINGLGHEATVMKRNESVTLAKAGVNRNGVRLSCQIAVDDDLSDTVICILENEY